jgi:hypothetical protein
MQGIISELSAPNDNDQNLLTDSSAGYILTSCLELYGTALYNIKEQGCKVNLQLLHMLQSVVEALRVKLSEVQTRSSFNLVFNFVHCKYAQLNFALSFDRTYALSTIYRLWLFIYLSSGIAP